MIRVNYTINGYEKLVTGTKISEDENFIVVKGSKDGTIFTIAKTTILEVRDDGR